MTNAVSEKNIRGWIEVLLRNQNTRSVRHEADVKLEDYSSVCGRMNLCEFPGIFEIYEWIDIPGNLPRAPQEYDIINLFKSDGRSQQAAFILLDYRKNLKWINKNDAPIFYKKTKKFVLMELHNDYESLEIFQK